MWAHEEEQRGKKGEERREKGRVKREEGERLLVQGLSPRQDMEVHWFVLQGVFYDQLQ